MKDKRVLLLVSTIVILALMFSTAFIRERQRNKTLTPPVVSESKPVETIQDDYAGWTLFRNGYALPVPPKWKNTSDLGGTAVLEPGEAVGNVQKISITVLSDKKAPVGQSFTTQKELTEWSAVTSEVQGSIQKPKNIILDGVEGVLLLDVSKEENNWIAIAWARKDSANIYLTFSGTGSFGMQEEKVVDYITSKFVFSAPPSTGKKE